MGFTLCLNDLAWNCTEVGEVFHQASGCNETLEEAPSTMAREVKFSDRHMTSNAKAVVASTCLSIRDES